MGQHACKARGPALQALAEDCGPAACHILMIRMRQPLQGPGGRSTEIDLSVAGEDVRAECEQSLLAGVAQIVVNAKDLLNRFQQ